MSMAGGGSDGEEDDDIRVAEYLLGLGDAAERAAMARRLADEPALAARLDRWQQRLSGLDREFAEVTPPATALSKLETRLFGGQAKRGWWNSLNLWRGLATAAAAVAVIAIGVNLMRPAPLSPDDFAAQMVAALEMDGSPARFVALYDQTTGMMRLVVLAGEASPDKDYELWAIHGSDAPVSMGVIPAAGRAEKTVAPGDRGMIAPGTVLAVTLEPKGGSPTGSPTGPMMAKGMATQI
jgi:anti-sigma-K factor RskA